MYDASGSVSLNDILTCARMFLKLPQYFIRQNTASTIAHRMQYLDESVGEAAEHVVDDLFWDSGMGGVIAVDRQGNGKQSRISSPHT